jgi:hypothetical protein
LTGSKEGIWKIRARNLNSEPQYLLMTRGLNIKVGPQEKNQENNAKGIYK